MKILLSPSVEPSVEENIGIGIPIEDTSPHIPLNSEIQTLNIGDAKTLPIVEEEPVLSENAPPPIEERPDASMPPSRQINPSATTEADDKSLQDWVLWVLDNSNGKTATRGDIEKQIVQLRGSVSPDGLTKALNALVDQGKMRRVRHGVYQRL